jgi:hypothetical protein
MKSSVINRTHAAAVFCILSLHSGSGVSLAAEQGSGMVVAPSDRKTATVPQQPKEVNVATISRGASIVSDSLGNDLIGLIDNTAGKSATMVPDKGASAAICRINLAALTDVTRVALQVGNQKGTLRIVALNGSGDVSDPDKALATGKVLSSLRLDGKNTDLSIDLGSASVKNVAVIWIPDVPGQALTVTNVGLFTRNPPPESVPRTASTVAQAAANSSTATEADKSSRSNTGSSAAASDAAGAASPASANSIGQPSFTTGTSSTDGLRSDSTPPPVPPAVRPVSVI